MKLIITDIENFKNPVNGEYKLISPNSPIKNCIGCFGCWLRTPGECVIRDEYGDMGVILSECDELIIVSECYYGCVSPFVKSVLDRTISYVQPDFIIKNDEMHHKPRYDNCVQFSVHLYGESITDDEKTTARNWAKAVMVNFNGIVKTVDFCSNLSKAEGIEL